MNNFKHLDESVATVSTVQVNSDSSENSSVTSSSSWDDVDLVEPHVGYKKVLVTGGAGFIGSHVADFLLERGDDVVIVDEMNDYYDVSIKESNLRLLTGKYGDKRVINATIII